MTVSKKKEVNGDSQRIEIVKTGRDLEPTFHLSVNIGKFTNLSMTFKDIMEDKDFANFQANINMAQDLIVYANEKMSSFIPTQPTNTATTKVITDRPELKDITNPQQVPADIYPPEGGCKECDSTKLTYRFIPMKGGMKNDWHSFVCTDPDCKVVDTKSGKTYPTATTVYPSTTPPQASAPAVVADTSEDDIPF